MSLLFNLCRLDCYKLLSQKYTFIIFALVSVVMMLFVPQSIYLLSLIMSYFVGLTIITLDEQSHCNYLYSRLAASRKNIVTARFVLFFIQSLCITAILFLIGYFSPFSQMDPSLIYLTIISFCMSMIFLGFMQAFSFYFKLNTVRFIAIFIYVMLFTSFNNLPALTFLLPSSLALVISTLVIYLGCLIVAMKLYTRKQFID